MVAKNIRLPNIRKFFVPDIGYTVCDADLSGADAQVVAWEADDADLKEAFKQGLKIHIHNARTIWPHETKDMTNEELSTASMYKQVKAGCHAVNYGASDNALVLNNGWTSKFAQEFRERWFSAHPNIRNWHKRFERYLYGTQCWNCDAMAEDVGGRCGECGKKLGNTVKNRFGFRRIFFDRADGGLLPEALAWVPQSTVAFCTEIGWTAIAHGPQCEMLSGFGELSHYNWSRYLVEPNSYNKWHNIVQFLIQVHDSIVFQVPFEYEKNIPEIVNDMRVIVPYDDPLIIPMGYAYSRKSWGDCV